MKTIIAAFRDTDAAETGADLLRAQFGTYNKADNVHIELLDYGDTGAGLITKLKSNNVPKDRAHAYAEIARRGAALLIAEVPDANAEELANKLDRLGSLDLDAAEKRWRSEGWLGYEENSLPFNAEETATERTALLRDSELATEASEPDAKEDLEVVEERVEVGKREVPRGGVRIRTYVIERPVQETVQLREEHIDVQREQVDEPISQASADSTFTEEEFEVTAQGEEAVVGKEARVVERVHVGKTADTRTETIEDTERRRDVEVEEIEEPLNPRRG